MNEEQIEIEWVDDHVRLCVQSTMHDACVFDSYLLASSRIFCFFLLSQETFSHFICIILWSRFSRRTFCLIAFIAQSLTNSLYKYMQSMWRRRFFLEFHNNCIPLSFIVLHSSCDHLSRAHPYYSKVCACSPRVTTKSGTLPRRAH